MKEWFDSYSIHYAKGAAKIEIFEIIKSDQDSRHLLLIVFWHDMDILLYVYLPTISSLSQQNK
jgi:hypothetical protein